MQSNQIMYSSERLLKLEGKKNTKDLIVQATSLGDKHKNIKHNINTESTTDSKRISSANRIKTVDERLPAYYVRSRSAAKIRERERGIGGYVSQYAHLQKKDDTNTLNNIRQTATGKSILRILFVEKLNLIIAASEDKNIYVWGFDTEALKALSTLRDHTDDINASTEGIHIFVISLKKNSFSFSIEGAEVANRVVGFTLLKIFAEHESLVTSLALVDDDDTFGRVFLLSSGWDRRICIWDLTGYRLFSTFSNPNSLTIEEVQMAANGSIQDMDYSPYLKYFAYASTDMCVYVRKFSPTGSEMKLVYKLTTKLDSEVTCVKWNFITNQWVTGMENGEIRIWVIDISFFFISIILKHFEGTKWRI
jgi:WD40 repeat protein